MYVQGVPEKMYICGKVSHLFSYGSSLFYSLKGVKLCIRYPYFYFQHGENTSTASQLSKEINKVSSLCFPSYFELWYFRHEPFF